MAVKKTRVVPSDSGSRIKRVRERHGLTQTRLAALLGVSFALVNRWENGQNKPTLAFWRQILRLEKHGLNAVPDDHATETTAYEADARYGKPDVVPTDDFLGSPEKLWVVAEGEGLMHGHLFNPWFATETSLIDPLPHQRLAVYEHMLAQHRRCVMSIPELVASLDATLLCAQEAFSFWICPRYGRRSRR